MMRRTSPQNEERKKRILEQYPALLAINELINNSEVDTTQLKSAFNQFMDSMAQHWSEKPDMEYADFNKWKSISNAFRIFSTFINSDRTLTHEPSFNKIMGDIQRLSLDFALTIQDETAKAATTQFSRLDLALKQGEKSEEQVAAEKIIKQKESVELSPEARTEIAAFKRLTRRLERLEREVVRLRPFEQVPTQRRVNQLGLEVAAKDQEIESLKLELQKANQAFAKSKSTHSDELAKQRAELESMKKDQQSMLQALSAREAKIQAQEDDTASRISEQAAKIKEQSTIISDFRSEIESLKAEKEELEKVILEGSEEFLQEKVAAERKAAADSKKELDEMKEKYKKLERTTVRLQDGYDVLSSATSKLLKKAGSKKTIPPVATTAQAENEGKAVITPELSPVKTRWEQAKAAAEIVDSLHVSKSKRMVGLFDPVTSTTMSKSPSTTSASSDSESAETDSDSAPTTPRKDS